MKPRAPRSTRTDTLLSYTTLVRSVHPGGEKHGSHADARDDLDLPARDSANHPGGFSPGGRAGDRRGYCGRDDHCQCRNRFRSEEHTSELQSLMRISYAVFCLKKKDTQRERQKLSVAS